MMQKKGLILASSSVLNNLCNKQQGKTLGKKVTLRFDLHINSMKVLFRMPNAFSTTN
jgi:hypothetical protein